MTYRGAPTTPERPVSGPEKLPAAGLEDDGLARSADKEPGTGRELLDLALCLALPQLAGFGGSLLSRSAFQGWYESLDKPDFNPPSAVFGPVWTVLYLMMGLALYLVRRRGRRGADTTAAQSLFAAQFVLNATWTPLFFGLRSPALGLVDIIPLWFAIAATIRAFWKISPVAGLLLIPYFLWTSFALVLNATIWWINR